MNRKRPCYQRLLHPVTLRDGTRDPSRDVTPVTLFRRPLLLCGLLCYLGAAAALVCSLFAPALVLGVGGAACVIRYHSIFAEHRTQPPAEENFRATSCHRQHPPLSSPPHDHW